MQHDLKNGAILRAYLSFIFTIFHLKQFIINYLTF